MNGVAAVRSLLVNASGVTALVPAARIVAGTLPLDTVLPAISIADVSGVDLQFTDDSAQRFTTDRVQVTVAAANYPSLVAVLAEAKSACDAKRPTISGLSNVSVRTDGQGPYFTDEAASLHMKSQDFRVSYTQDA